MFISTCPAQNSEKNLLLTVSWQNVGVRAYLVYCEYFVFQGLIVIEEMGDLFFQPLATASLFQKPPFRETHTGYSAGPGLESYLKGFNFTGEPPWQLCT